MGLINTEIESELSRLARIVKDDYVIFNWSGTINADTYQFQPVMISNLWGSSVSTLELVAVEFYHDTALTDNQAQTVMLTKCSEGTAPADSITYLMTNGSQSWKGFDLKADAGTVQDATLTNQVSSLTFSDPDRLVVGLNGTLSTTRIQFCAVFQKNYA